MFWVYSIDAGLAPVGLAVAFATESSPYGVVLALPLVGLLSVFARERRVRIDHELELRDAYRGTAFLLGDVVEADDEYTGLHSRDVVELTMRVADELDLSTRERRDAEFVALLHDVGKVRELSYDRTFGYTDEGQLVGHIVIGVEMLQAKAVRVPDLTGEPFPGELLLRLKHMIVSHHGEYAFGSPKLPMTPEAIALHHLDNLDAKVHSFTRDIREDRNQTSAWTQYNPALQRRLFKGCVDGSEPVYSPTLEAVE
jgi:hypothetical protein